MAAGVMAEAVRNHYLARWGEPSRRAHFQSGAFQVEIYKWRAETNREGVNIYATIGASARPMVGREEQHRVEFFLGLLPARDEVASPLAALALYAAREQVAVSHGDTVPADGALWEGTEMRRFLVVRPVTAVIEPLAVPQDGHVEFLQAIPIFDSELTYKKEHDAEALLHRWEQAGVQFWNPNREPEAG